jgi:hypothetical protein
VLWLSLEENRGNAASIGMSNGTQPTTAGGEEPERLRRGNIPDSTNHLTKRVPIRIQRHGHQTDS